jgi:hypothetical protein
MAEPIIGSPGISSPVIASAGIALPGPLPFTLLLDEALRQARLHFRAIFPWVAIPATILSTAVAVVQAVWFSRLMMEIGDPHSPLPSLGYLAAIFLYCGLLVIAYNPMQVAAMDAVAGRAVDLRRAWRFTLGWRVTGTLVLAYLATLASLFCCCLPSLFFIPLITLLPAVMAEEGRAGFRGVLRSVRLTWHFPRGRWWESPLIKAFLLLLVGLLLGYLAALVVSLPFQLPMYIDMLRKAAAGKDVAQGVSAWVWLQVPAQLLGSLASTAVYLYISFGVALLFHDTRDRREGTDLLAAIDAAFPAGEPPSLLPAGLPTGELRP